MSDDDIVADLLECAADSRATEGDYYADQFATAPEIFERAAAEIARLRLTDAEREALRFALSRLYGTLRGNEECDHADALQGLLQRLAP